jgi:hypothetical protein
MLRLAKFLPRNLGDKVERVVKPLAIILQMPCLDSAKELRPESECGKRKKFLNEITPPHDVR